MRTCSQCGETKPFEDFHIRADNSEGRASECKTCNSKRGREWRDANPDRHKENYLKWGKENKDKKAVNAKRWKLLNPDKIKASSKKYYEKHRKKRQVYERAWRQANPDKIRERDHRHRARINNAGGSFTEHEFTELCIRHGDVCVCCGEGGKLTVDHIVPLSRGGANNIDNIQPLCLSCNSKKYVHTVDYRNAQISFV